MVVCVCVGGGGGVQMTIASRDLLKNGCGTCFFFISRLCIGQRTSASLICLDLIRVHLNEKNI